MNDTIAQNSDTMECYLCSKVFTPKSARAKYCSEACKQKAKRIRELDLVGGPPQTDVDKAFEKHKPNYYRFGGVVRDVECIVCDKKFKTSLKLLKTCSVEHRDKMLAMLSGQR